MPINRTLTNFICTLPVRCRHPNLPDANFCSTCGAELTTDFDPYFRHWFYSYVYKTLRPIFDEKHSVYTLLERVSFSSNPKTSTSCSIRMGQFVEGNDEGLFFPMVGVAGDDFSFDETGYYRCTLPDTTGRGGIEPVDFFDLLCTQYVDNYEYLIDYYLAWDHTILHELDSNRPKDFEEFAIAVMTHLDKKISFGVSTDQWW